MAPTSLDQFGKAIVASGPLTANDWKSLWVAISSGERPTDDETFARRLTESGTLMEFQSQELLRGDTMRLVLNQYDAIRDYIGCPQHILPFGEPIRELVSGV